MINTEVFVRQITSNGTLEGVHTFNAPIVKETVQKGQVELYKADEESGNMLANAKYGIYFHNGTKVGSLTTNSNGYAKSNLLPYGSYYLKETTAPDGYVLDSTRHPFSIDADGQVVTIDATDKLQKGTISITKTDEESGNILPNAVFDVFAKTDIITADGVLKHKAGDLVDTVTGQANGIATTKELYLGQYTVKEKTAPEGYVLNTSPYDVTLTYAGQNVTITTASQTVANKNQMGKIIIKKTDEESGKGLPNAVFEIFAKTDIKTPENTIKYHADDLVDTVTSQANGIAESKLLYLGQYTVKEKTAPEGYVLNTSPYDVTLTYAGQEVEVTTTEQTIPNKNQMGQITGEKTGEVLTGSDFRLTELGMMYSPIYEVQGLPNAVYGIYAKVDIKTPEGTLKYKKGELADTVTTDAQGKFMSKELYLGTYTIKEKTAPNGYVLDKNEYDVTLSYGGQDKDIVLSSLSLSDERQKVSITLKKDMEDNTIYPNPEAYKDVRFGLYAADDIKDINGNVAFEKDNLLEVLTINKDGIGTVSSDLPIGKYYVQEIATNKTYVLNDTKYPVDFEYQGQDTAVVKVVANQGEAIPNPLIKGQVELYKKSDLPQDALLQGFENIPLANAVYGIYDINGNEVTQLITDLKGYVKSELLPYGQYYVKEISPPFGYHLNEQEYPFEIKEDGEIITIHATDEPKIGAITAKYDEHGGSDGLSHMDNVKTGDNGFMLYMSVGVFLGSMIVLVVIVIFRKIN